MATPLALVVTAIVFVPPAKVPLAPEFGAVNVTEALGIATPPASKMVTFRFMAKA